MPSRMAPTRLENLLRLSVVAYGGNPDTEVSELSPPCDLISEVRPLLTESRRLTAALRVLGKGFWSVSRAESSWEARATWEGGEACCLGASTKAEAEEQLLALLEEIGNG